jgi:1,4-dihydroxy-2-naphthoate polyprenyltransferase
MQAQLKRVLFPWLIGVRPKTLTASCLPVCIGACLAFKDGFFQRSILACTLLAALFVQMGINLINDAIDFKKGADTERRLGPKRLSQSGMKTMPQVLLGGFVCYALACIVSLPLMTSGGAPFIAALFSCLLCGFFYTGGKYPLAYHGLGDCFVLLFFGLMAVSFSYYLHTGFFSFKSFYIGIEMGLLAVPMIAMNNIRDIQEDTRANKKTLAVILGENFAKKEIAVCYFLAFSQLFYFLWMGSTLAFLLPLCTFPLVLKLIFTLFKEKPSSFYNILLAQAAFIHCAFGLLLIIGLLL